MMGCVSRSCRLYNTLIIIIKLEIKMNIRLQRTYDGFVVLPLTDERKNPQEA